MKQFSFYAAVSAAVAGVAALVVALVPVTETSRSAAWLAVGIAAATGAVALLLKRRAMASDGLNALTAGMKTLGLVIAMRAALLTAGLYWVARHNDGGAPAFVACFFAIYVGQQWLEVSYLLTEQKRHSQLRKAEAP